MKISFVTTVYNEEKTIQRLLHSLSDQSLSPDEIIVVDGGSTDRTIDQIENYKRQNKKPHNIIVLRKSGNRSIGRNEGIEKASGDIIVLSDAGCILDKNFINEIVNPFVDKTVDVVAGYYKGEAKTIFQKCLIPYVLVMPDKINPDTFLPATRSMAIRKSVWNEMQGFPEEYSHNEDFVFAKKLQKNGKKIHFSRDAVVTWIPRDNFRQAFYMFYRFALGDMEAGIVRMKVLVLFARYFIGLLLVIYFVVFREPLLGVMLLLSFVFYCIWAVAKNYRYVKDWKAIYILPLLQITADIAVLLGSFRGILKRYGI